MALEGNLTAFGLSEILQLIAVQQKTGMLSVTNVDATTVMFFRSGEIVSTRDRRRRSKDPFKDYMTRYGVLTREQLIRISQLSSQSKLDFVDVVLSEGIVGREELAKHWQKQIQEAMHDVLTWEEGQYRFIPSEEIVDGIKTLGSFSVESMLMESMRRIDEFPQMLEMFPSDQVTVRRRETEAARGDDLTQNERDLLALLGRAVSLRDLIAHARMPLFEVYEALKLLRERGAIEVEQPKSAAREARGEGGEKGHRRRERHNPLPLVVALLAFCGAVWVGFHAEFEDLSAGSMPSTTILGDQDLSRRQVEYRLRWLIDAYRARNGAYPAKLADLQTDGLASPRLLAAARRHAIRYRLTGGRTAYTLL